MITVSGGTTTVSKIIAAGAQYAVNDTGILNIVDGGTVDTGHRHHQTPPISVLPNLPFDAQSKGAVVHENTRENIASASEVEKYLQI